MRTVVGAVSVSNDDRVMDWRPLRNTALLAVLPIMIGIGTVQRPGWWPLYGAVAVLAVVVAGYLTRKAARTRKPSPPSLGLAPVSGPLAGGLLLIFLGTLPSIARHSHHPWLIVLSGMLLWLSALAALWPLAGSGYSLFLMFNAAAGEAALLLAVGVLRHGGLVVGAGLLLLGVAAVLFGVGGPLFGRLLMSMGDIGATDNPRFNAGILLFGLALLLVGAGLLVFGVDLLRHGDLVAGIAVLFFGATPGLTAGALMFM